MKFFKKECHGYTRYVKVISDDDYTISTVSAYFNNITIEYGCIPVDFTYLGYFEIPKEEYNSILEL